MSGDTVRAAAQRDVPSTSTTLLRDLADSQHARWGEFVRRYQPMMAEYLRAHFPGIEVDDVVSETLVALVDVLKNYRYAPDETGCFHNYLTGILKHKALYRCRVAERHAKDVAAYREHANRADDSRAADEEREWKETVFAIAVRQLLADETIQDRTKQVFLRVAINHESPDAVAESFGIKRNAVDQMKSRMMGKLREIAESLKSVV